MTLSKLERVLLINQLELRKALTKSKDFDEAIEILEAGYEIFYEEALGRVHDPMAEEDCHFVLEVLDMYRAIEGFHEAHPGDEEIDKMYAPHFRGFDGNNESAHMTFTRFLINDQRKFTEQLKYEKDTDSFNSHWTMIPTYRAYLEKWKAMKDRWNLTREQVVEILSSKDAT